jgi:hypothetical protein
MRLLLMYIPLLTLVLFSCNNVRNQQYISRIDSLDLQLENATAIYPEIDSTAFVKIRTNVAVNCKTIDFKDDSNYSKLFIPYSQINKSLKHMLKMDFQIRREILKANEQIDNLLHDVNKNLINTKVLVEYIEEEEKAVNELINKMNFNNQLMIAETKKYDSLNPIIENLIKKKN